MYHRQIRPLGGDENRALKDPKLKGMRETLAAMNLALANQKLLNVEIWIQLAEKDPPDFRLLRKADGNPDDVVRVEVEHTSFAHKGFKASIADQLEKTKFSPTSDQARHLLLIEVDQQSNEQTIEVHRAMKRAKVKYEVWLMRGRYERGSKEIEVHALNVFPNEYAPLLVDAEFEMQRFPNQTRRLHLVRKGAIVPPPAPPPLVSTGDPSPWPNLLKLRY
jgi:hypothetical protein